MWHYVTILQAIRWLRGDRHDIEGEIKALENSQRKSDDTAGSASGQVDQKNSTLHELSKPSAYKPFLLLIGIFILQQSTGTYAVIFYAVNVFQVRPSSSITIQACSLGILFHFLFLSAVDFAVQLLPLNCT